MAIIYSYPYDQIITDTDAWVGTDSVNRQTKQYTAKAVADYLNINGKVAIAGQMNYQFVQEPSYKSGTFAFAGSGGDNTRWSSITSIVISNMDLSGQIVSPFLEYLVDEQVMFQDVADKGSFGHYIMRGYTQIGTTNFYTLTLEYIGGNGSININHYYTLVNFYLEQGDSKVETIDTTNTTFIDMTPTSPTSGDVTITASLSATGTPDNTKFLRGDNFWSTVNLQSVLTAGNTYVSPDGYGTFTLNDITNNNGNIKYVNTDEGWGYALNAEEGLYFTDGAGSQSGKSGIGLDSIYIGYINYIGQINSFGITADRTYTLPNASGTIALTSDIESYSEWAEYSGTRAGGDLLVSIGDYDDSGNGSKFKIDDDANTVYVSGSELNITDGSLILSSAGFNGQLSASNITAARTLQFPDTSGTIALTSDIPAPGPSGSGTTNYTARWTNASTLGIGTLYDNGNNVGIGTTNPVNKLHVHNGITRLDSGSASSNALGVYSNFSTTAINLFTGSTGSGFISVNNNGMNLGAPWNGGAKVSILNNGNVGIGTTSPGSTLPTDSETASKVLQLTGAGGSTGDTAVLLRSLDNSSGLDLWHNVSSGDSYIDNRYNSNQGDTIFRVKTAGTPLEALRITGNGNVGIGTTSPSQKLHVVGVGSFGTSTSQTLVDYDGLNAVGNTDYIRFKVDNSEKLRIKSNGNVGIGTTSPTKLLEVKSSSAYDSTVRLSTTAHNWDIQGGESGYSSTAFAIDYDGVTFFRAIGTTDSRFGSGLSVGSISTAPPTGGLYVAGNVGIGTTAPSSRLEIASYNVASSISDVGANSLLTLDTTVNTGINLKAGITNNYNAYIQGYNSQSTSSRSLVLNPFGGNVGIGTTSPSHKLDVAGDIKLTNSNSIYWRNAANNADIPLLNLSSTNIFNVGTTSSSVPVQIALHTAGSEKMRITSAGNVGIGTTSPTKDLEIGTSAAAETEFRMHSDESGRYFNIQSAGNFTSVRTTGSQNFILDSSGSSGYVTFVTNASERMRVNYNGNVGIGTTSPLSKLNVNGDIKIEGENELYFGSSGSVPLWEIKASGSDLVINDTGSNVGSVLFNNDEGIVLPRLTTTEINAISLPNTGLTVYNTTLNTLCFYNGSSWQKVSHTNM